MVSSVTSPTLYKLPTRQEIFGFKRPTPKTINRRPQKILHYENARDKCPTHNKNPPNVTAFFVDINLSPTILPGMQAKYTRLRVPAIYSCIASALVQPKPGLEIFCSEIKYKTKWFHTVVTKTFP